MNSSKNKILLVIIGILLISNFAMLFFFLGFKDSGKDARRDRPGGLSEFVKTELGFNEQQAQQYEEIKKEHRAKIRPLFEDLRKTKYDFYLRLTDTLLVENHIDSSARLIGNKQTALDAEVFRHFSNLRNLCTPQQRATFDSLFPQIVRRMTSGHGKDKGKRTEGEHKKESN